MGEPPRYYFEPAVMKKKTTTEVYFFFIIDKYYGFFYGFFYRLFCTHSINAIAARFCIVVERMRAHVHISSRRLHYATSPNAYLRV